jgi:flagellar biosynthetic protein FliO
MDLARQSLAITFVLGLLWAALWLLKRRGLVPGRRTQSGRGSLESCGKLSLTAQHSIHLVRIGDRNLVLAVHPGGITFLCDASGAAVREPQGRPAS